MGIWRQTSLFAYKNDWTLENIITSFKFMGEPSPYALVRKHIEMFSGKGDLILDPGCGNGTAGIIALELGRRAVMSDVNALAVRTVEALFLSGDDAAAAAAAKETVKRVGRMNAERVMHAMDAAVREMTADRSEEESISAEAAVLMKTVLSADWDQFTSTPLPDLPGFSRVVQKRAQRVGDLFHPPDLLQLEAIYYDITRLPDAGMRELLLTVFCHTLLESSQLIKGRNRQNISVPPNPVPKHPIDRFRDNLELFLAYRRMIREKGLQCGQKPPEIVQTSAKSLSFLRAGSVDYIMFDLPDMQTVRESEWTYIPELLLQRRTDGEAEWVIELDYRGRYQIVRELKQLLRELDRVLKEDGYLTFIFPGHYVLFSLMTGVAQDEGWQLIQGRVEMFRQGKKDEYPLMSLTMQKRSYHTVLGALNKMKTETLYDTEEAILRKIDHYLTEYGTAATGEIQHFLIESCLHDCLIEKPLEHLLGENFIWSGRYWIKPSPEQREELFIKRTEVMRESFPKFVAEMVYIFLQDEKAALTYEELSNRLLKAKPRTVFHTPYYRLLMEQCERRGIPLRMVLENFMEGEKKDPFETRAAVIRRLVRNERAFTELAAGEWIALAEWPKESFFKKYLELYEKARHKRDMQSARELGRKVLELLPEIQYLEERKKAKIREYIVRSEEA